MGADVSALGCRQTPDRWCFAFFECDQTVCPHDVEHQSHIASDVAQRQRRIRPCDTAEDPKATASRNVRYSEYNKSGP